MTATQSEVINLIKSAKMLSEKGVVTRTELQLSANIGPSNGLATFNSITSIEPSIPLAESLSWQRIINNNQKDSVVCCELEVGLCLNSLEYFSKNIQDPQLLSRIEQEYLFRRLYKNFVVKENSGIDYGTKLEFHEIEKLFESTVFPPLRNIFAALLQYLRFDSGKVYIESTKLDVAYNILEPDLFENARKFKNQWGGPWF